MFSPRNLSTILKRELAAYFNSAVAYIFIIVFVFMSCGLFMTQFFLAGMADMRAFFGSLPLLLSVFIPAITMRLWAEEKKGNTQELLLTFPMGPHELVLGKYFASLIFYLVALAGTLTVPIMILSLGSPDAGAMTTSYLGAVLLGSFFLAAGIFISGLCHDQIVAFILSMMLCFGIYFLGTEFMAVSIDGWLPGWGTFLRHFIGAGSHFHSFAKGVIAGQDVFYFLLGTVLFLVLNGFWMEGRMRPGKKVMFTAVTVVAAGIFLTANWLTAETGLGRFDLTEGRIYSVSPATKNILDRLETDALIKLYISPSEKMPTPMKSLEQDVTGKLEELRILSGGKLKYKVLHMEAGQLLEKDEEKGGELSVEEELQTKGISPFQVQAMESDELDVRLIYSAISISYKDRAEEVLPRIMPDTLYELEYLLASKLFRMTLDKVPSISILAPYEEEKVDPKLVGILAQMGANIPMTQKVDDYEVVEAALNYEGYEVSRISLTEEDPVPEGTDTLVVLEPLHFNERQAYEINRFLAQGGSLLLAVQKNTFEYDPSEGVLKIFPRREDTGLEDVMKNWGIEVLPEILADREHEAINLQGGARLGPFSLTVPVKLPVHILIPASGMNPDVSITSHLSSLFYLWGSALSLNEDRLKEEGVSVETLLHSSSDSWLLPFAEGPLVPADFNESASVETGPFPLAVLASGQFADAWSGENVPLWPKSPEEDSSESEAAEETVSQLNLQPGKLFVTGSTTIFQKKLIQGGGHLSLFLNTIDVLTLSEELVEIRSKRPIDRTLGKISRTEKITWRMLCTLLVPFLLALGGSLRLMFRQRSKYQYLRSLQKSAL